MTATLDVLNVGLGDLKLRFNPDDAADVERAQSTIEALLRQGYAICIEKADGRYARVKRFDRANDCYIVSEVGSGNQASAQAGQESGEIEAEGAAKPRGRGRGRAVAESKHPRGSTKATALGPSAGG